MTKQLVEDHGGSSVMDKLSPTNVPPDAPTPTGGRWALLAISLLCLGGSGAALLLGHRPVPPPIVITPPTTAETGPTPSTPPLHAASSALPRIYVHVAGAVRKPSLYALPPGSRVMAAVTKAGGPTPKADLDAVNLAEKLQDGEKIYIPPKRETEATPQASPVPPGNEIGHQSVLPQPAPIAVPMTPAKTRTATADKPAGKSQRGGQSKADKLTSPTEGQVALNTATEEQLERLPGVGPAMAGRILDYRRQAGGFRKIDDLMEVRGIGAKKFARIEPFVRVE